MKTIAKRRAKQPLLATRIGANHAYIVEVERTTDSPAEGEIAELSLNEPRKRRADERAASVENQSLEGVIK